MKKSIIILAAMCGMFSLSSCGNVTWSQVQNQIASLITLDATTSLIVTNVLENHPESLDLFRKISADLVKLSEKDVLTLDDVKADISNRIADSNVPCKTEILLAVDKIFDNISSDPKFDIAAHKGEILDIASGINWAVRYYEENHTNEAIVTPQK